MHDVWVLKALGRDKKNLFNKLGEIFPQNKPKVTAQPASWMCSICTFSNDISTNSCNMCGSVNVNKKILEIKLTLFVFAKRQHQ